MKTNFPYDFVFNPNPPGLGYTWYTILRCETALYAEVQKMKKKFNFENFFCLFLTY
jgi:hypothetical protein